MERRAIQDQLRIENHCYGCGPDNPDGLQLKSYWEGEETVALFQPRPAFMAGPRHVLNGGVIATVLDCHGICTAVAAGYRALGRPMGSEPLLWCATARLEVEYLRPTPLGPELTLRAQVEATEGRRTTVLGRLFAEGIECARGRVVAVQVRASWGRAPEGSHGAAG